MVLFTSFTFFKYKLECVEMIRPVLRGVVARDLLVSQSALNSLFAFFTSVEKIGHLLLKIDLELGVVLRNLEQVHVAVK